MARAKALYDFNAENSGELSFKANDVIEILNKEIGEGWWEGAVKGKRGLFPASYVQVLAATSSAPTNAPPAVPSAAAKPAVVVSNSGGGGGGDDFDDGDWDDSGDDDWDDRGGGGNEAAQTASVQSFVAGGGGGGGAGDGGVAGPGLDTDTSRAGTLKRSVNRFSVFVKAGAEAYLLGAVKDKTINPKRVLHIENTKDGPAWVKPERNYGQIRIAHKGKEHKYGGLKSYEAYTIILGDGVQVERRFKHFAWLHDRLVDAYPCICVPPLPGKEFDPKFGEELTHKRQERLQQWMNRVCRHPVLTRDDKVLHHFLTCANTDTKAWKDGKRAAEKDDFVGAQFFRLISQDVPCPSDSDKQIDNFSDFVNEMTKTVKKNIDISKAHGDKMATGIKREYVRIAQGFGALADTFSKGQATNGDTVRLSGALQKAQEHVNNIAELWGEQPKYDQIPWSEGLKEYAGLLTQFTGCISSSRSASQRFVEVDANETADKHEKETVRKRCDVIHTLALCEMGHFHKDRRKDFRDLMSSYFAAQIEFHQKIVQQLQAAKAKFDELQLA